MKFRYKFLIMIFFGLFVNMTLMADSNTGGNKAFKKENYSKAFSLYSDAIEQHPSHPIPEMNLGSVLFELEDYENALVRYDKALKKYTDKGMGDVGLLSDIYYNTGLIYFKLDKHQQALNAFKESLKLSPNDKSAKYNWFNLKKLMENSEKQSAKLGEEEQKSTKENQESSQENKNNPEIRQTDNQKENQQNKSEKNIKNQQNSKRTIEASKEEMRSFLKQMNNKEIINRKNTRIINNERNLENLSPKYEKDW